MNGRIIVGGIIAISCIFFGLKLFKKWNILDKPGNDQQIKRKSVPTILGIFIFLASIIFIAIAFPNFLQHKIFLGLISGGFIIVSVAILDELHYIGKSTLKIPVWIRIFSHLIGAGVAIRIGGIEINELTLGNSTFIIPQWLSIFFFMIWSFICINAINRFDYGNGQASGVSAIGFLTIVLLIHFIVLPSYPYITIIHKSTLEMVEILGLMFFGLSTIASAIEYKPIGLMRDVGTMFFGFALAYLSVLGGAKIGTLLVVLSLVLFDAIWVGLHRIFFLKTNPLKGDYNHLHHRLAALKRNKAEIRMFVWIWSIIMMILMLLQGSNRINKIIIFVMMAVVFFGVHTYIFRVKKFPCGLTGKKE